MKTAIAAWAAMIAGALFGATRIVATESGADATGATDATAAIQRCLDKVAQAGGGTVYLPPGLYRLEGSLSIGARTRLDLAGGARDAREEYTDAVRVRRAIRTSR